MQTLTHFLLLLLIMLISQSVFALNVESHAEEGAGCAGRPAGSNNSA